MHELALAEAVLEIVEDGVRDSGAARARVVRLAIGALSHADPDALAFCFEAVAKGTVAEGARMDIARVPGQAWCRDCRVSVQLDAWGDACPRCGGHALQVTGGGELRVREIEVE